MTKGKNKQQRSARRIVATVMLGVLLTAVTALGALYLLRPGMFGRLYAYALSMVYVDRLSYKPYSRMAYDGIDVSKHNGVIHWNQVAANKRTKFVYIKATEGKSLVDRRYKKNLRGAKKVGLPVGSYHFLTSRSPIRAQFENFKRHAVKEEQDLIPVLDVEEDGIKGKWTARQLQDSVALFASLVEQHYGQPPIIYSGEHFYNRHLSPRFDKHLLFIANYRRRPLLRTRHHLWQFSQRGHVKGIGEYVDLIKLENGTAVEQLRLDLAK